MLSKIQKIWTWIFAAMFIVPEVLFLIIPSSIINYTGKTFLTLLTPFFDSRFFINHPSLFFTVLIIELLGLVGLFAITIKANKKLFAICLLLISLWLIFLIFLAYISNSVNFIM